METSACVGDATTVVDVAVLFATVTSFVVGVTLIVFEIIVPGGVLAPTFTTIGKLTCVPEGTAAPEQLGPVPGQQVIAPVPPALGIAVQIQPEGMPSETNVVFAGTEPMN